MKFNDKEGRSIYLDDSCDTIYAYHNEYQVGYIQFCVSEYMQEYGRSTQIAYLEQMHMDKSYQRCGIGTQIIKYAKTIYDEVKFAEDTGCGGNTDEIHYSSEGLAFKDYCEMNRITQNTLEQEEYDDAF